MENLNDLYAFISNLDPIDILLYFAIVILVILIISLIYVIKTGEDEPVYEPSYDKHEELDLRAVMNDINNDNYENNIVTNYETEQEEKAIISYQELLNQNKYGRLDYEEEKKNDEIVIKKVNLENLTKPKIEEEPKNTSKSVKFEEEKEDLPKSIIFDEEKKEISKLTKYEEEKEAISQLAKYEEKNKEVPRLNKYEERKEPIKLVKYGKIKSGERDYPKTVKYQKEEDFLKNLKQLNELIH